MNWQQESPFDQMWSVPVRPKKPLPAKPNFWVMRNAAQSSLYKEKLKVTEEFDKKLSVAEMNARCWFDEDKARAEMEVEALWKGRVVARNILHFLFIGCANCDAKSMGRTLGPT